MRVFITYAREDEGYIAWVVRLARTLRDRGFEPRLDELHLAGRELTAFMRAEVRSADRVLVLGSPGYKRKVEDAEDTGADHGVGHESSLLATYAKDQGGASVVVAWTRGARDDALPYYLRDSLAVDLRDPDPSTIDALAERLGAPAAAARNSFLDPLDQVDPLVGASGFTFAIDLRAWVDARWPSGRQAVIYPTWEEFQARDVHFPGGVVDAVEGHLARRRISLVVGNSASGKSVLGIGIAARWATEVGRRCLVLDLAEHEGLQPHEVRADVSRFIGLRGPSLLVLDNAQLMPGIMPQLLDRFEQAGASHRLLVLSRPVADEDPRRAGLTDRLREVAVSLNPDGAAFAGLARRLGRRVGTPPSWTAAQYVAWVDDFGGDLIAFGQAVLQALPRGEPTPDMAIAHIRRSYIDPVSASPPQLAALDRIAAASLLELSLEDRSLGGPAAERLRHLIEAGLVRSFERGHYRHWQLMHPGLGRMIAMVRARDQGQDATQYLVDALLDAARANPFLVGPASQRLARGGESDDRGGGPWFDALAREPQLICDWSITSPSRAVEVVRYAQLSIPWELVMAPDARPRLVDRLVATSAGDIVTFLRCAETLNPGPVVEVLAALLSRADFVERLVATPAHFVAAFLRYVEAHDRPTAVKVIAMLLSRTDFIERLVATPAGDIATFLRYAELHDWRRAVEVLTTLLSRVDFVERLVTTPAGDIATFLRYAQVHDRPKALAVVAMLLSRMDFVDRLAATPAGDMVTFLRYAEVHDRPRAVEVLTTLLSRTNLLDRLATTPAHFVAAFLRHVGTHDRQRAVEVLAALLSRADFVDRLAATPAEHAYAILRYAESYLPSKVAEVREALRARDAARRFGRGDAR